MTTDPKPGNPIPSRRGVARDTVFAWLEMAGFWSIAVAYPIFQGIASGTEALTQNGADRIDLSLTVVALVVIPATVLTGIEWLIASTLSKRSSRAFHGIVFGLAIAIVVWQQLWVHDYAGILQIAVPLLVGCSLAVGYARTEYFQNFAQIFILATPAVIVAFCLSYPVSSEVFPHEPKPDVAGIESDTPVVLVVFDELPLPAITTSQDQIDGELFPNFRRLGDSANWYANTHAVARQTLLAMPAILTGSAPKTENPATPPGEAEYPDNLCTILDRGGYAVTHFEPVTDFCGAGFSHIHRVASLIEQGADDGILPGPAIAAVKRGLNARYPEITPWINRTEQPEQFIAGLGPDDRRFSFLHSTLPHFEWYYMPSGQSYGTPSDLAIQPGLSDQVWQDEPAKIESAYQRLMLQTGYVDGIVGNLIDRMKSEGTWRRSLVIVTADHGASMVPGNSRRGLSDETSGGIIPVPLFVKFPGQTRGRKVNRPVSSLDIAPTVLDQLGVEPPAPLDGTPLRSDPGSPPDQGGDVAGLVPVWDIPANYGTTDDQLASRLQEVQRTRNRLFGDGTFYAIGGYSNLLGRNPEGQENLREVDHSQTKPSPGSSFFGEAGMNGATFEATLAQNPDVPGHRVAVSFAGEILATTRAWFEESEQAWKVAVVLPPSPEQRSTEGLFKVFEIEGGRRNGTN